LTEFKRKSGFAAIIGRPNVGKSTLMNRILGEKIAITSAKPQTTRNKILGIKTDEDHQIIFIDTPGMHSPKTQLGDYMVKSAESAMSGVDCILFLTCVSKSASASLADTEIVEKLKNRRVPAILVINKVDTIKKAEILTEIDKYKDYPFDEIVPISALKGENVDELLSVVKKYMKEGPEYFPGDMITDQPERVIAAERIREKALLALDDEIPHGIAVVINSMKKRDDKEIVDIEAEIYCERESHKRIVIGKNGEMLKKIGSSARIDIESFFDTKINLQLWVKVKKDWRSRDFFVRNFGYDKKNI